MPGPSRPDSPDARIEVTDPRNGVRGTTQKVTVFDVLVLYLVTPVNTLWCKKVSKTENASKKPIKKAKSDVFDEIPRGLEPLFRKVTKFISFWTRKVSPTLRSASTRTRACSSCWRWARM